MNIIATQLKSLATENRARADFFDLAADLHETGYQTDQARIDTEIQAYKDSKTQEIADLTERAVTAETERDALRAENDSLLVSNNEIIP